MKTMRLEYILPSAGDQEREEMTGMAKKYYAVKKGKTPGIYLTWEECRDQIHGFSGAVYQGFATSREAEDFLQGAGQEKPVKRDNASMPVMGDGEAVAYVDGSYRTETGEYGCGVVFFYEGEQTEISQRGQDRELASMRNVAGEIMGARLAMEEALRRGAKKLTIVHDYQGIASWCLGEWKTNKEGTIAYKRYYDSLKDRLVVSFQKVKGHSGDEWNDRADELARAACS